MANLLDSFKYTSVGSDGRILDYSSVLSPSGDFTKIFDLDAILTSWRNILITPKGSADHDPEFGSNLFNFVFEPADDDTLSGIKNDIYSNLMLYDNRAKITSIDITYLKNMKGFTVNIEVDYEGYSSDLNVLFDENTYQNYI